MKTYKRRKTFEEIVDDEKTMRDLEEYTERTAAKMGESAMCLTLFTDSYTKDIGATIQMACAIMMDKPIYLCVEKGTKVPEKIKKIADGIEYFDGKEDAMRASRVLIEKAIANLDIEPGTTPRGR